LHGGADISAGLYAARGLEVLAGDESEWLVSGVRPFASDAARFWPADCEFWLKIEEAALFSELVKLAPCNMSPVSERRGSSESGEGYCLWTLDAAERRGLLGEVAPSASLARCDLV
jgi:hypothetical protein